MRPSARVLSGRIATAAFGLASIAPAVLAFGAPLVGGAFERWAWRALSISCHQDPARTLAFAGSPMPVCARCAGIFLGLALALPFDRVVSTRPTVRLALLVSCASALALDVLLAGSLWPDLAAIRLLTGAAFGLAAALVIRSALR